MPNIAKAGLSVIIAAAILGALSDVLLNIFPWGINASIWIALLVLGVIVVSHQTRIDLKGGGRWLLLPSIGFAALIAWRGSSTLQVTNCLAVLILLAIAAVRSRAGQLRIAGLMEFLAAQWNAIMNATFGAFAVLLNVNIWKAAAPNRPGRFSAVGRGLLIALPLLILFGSLFAAADAIFAHWINSLFQWDFNAIVRHSVWIGFWAWITIGFLRQIFLMPLSTETRVDKTPAVTLGNIEIGTVLGLLNALFLMFVIIQFRYLFGGVDLIRESISLTYAEYARRGFFELVTVAALVLPMLLAMHYLIRREDRHMRQSTQCVPSGQQTFRVLAAILIALLFVIMFSALMRMKLYQDEFGLTELRVYTTAFMFWIAIVCVWFIQTVLRNQRDRFAFGALAAGMLVLIALNAINPDDLIVRVNAKRVNAPIITRAFDAHYATTLSSDAVPALIEALPSMSSFAQCEIATDLLHDWPVPDQVDWRTWNWSRIQAWWAVHDHQVYLQQVACP
jgi:hypothetical protein